jgi:formylglycine-generating enzyme required for sulfatase activity
MGSLPQEQERSDDEGPQHLVRLEGFFMGQTPITQAQWRAVARWLPREGERWGRELNPDPSSFQGENVHRLDGETNTDQRPVENVSWFDAVEFCSRLSHRTGRIYTLPSEAQWEYACRAGTSTPFHFGETISPDLANYNGNHTYGDGPKGRNRAQTAEVASFPANAWGLHDMHGNVDEWCLDEGHESYEGAPSDGRAWMDGKEADKSSEGEKTRLRRGGSWLDFPRYCRSAYRGRLKPGDAIDFVGVGFRVVCLPQGPSLNP